MSHGWAEQECHATALDGDLPGHTLRRVCEHFSVVGDLEGGEGVPGSTGREEGPAEGRAGEGREGGQVRVPLWAAGVRAAGSSGRQCGAHPSGTPVTMHMAPFFWLRRRQVLFFIPRPVGG